MKPRSKLVDRAAVLVLALVCSINVAAEDVNGNGAGLYLETADYWSGTANVNGNGAKLLAVGTNDDGGIQVNGNGAKMQIDPLTILGKSDAAQANFVATPRVGMGPLTVRFTDHSTGGPRGIVSWHWDFGDGNVSNEQNPTHTYQDNRPQTYTVTMEITTSVEKASVAKQEYIQVVEEMPATRPVTLLVLALAIAGSTVLCYRKTWKSGFAS